MIFLKNLLRLLLDRYERAMKESTDKSTRILCINKYLISGKKINLQSLADNFKVSKRTIQRDLDEIKAFYADEIVRDGDYKTVFYDKGTNRYRLD